MARTLRTKTGCGFPGNVDNNNMNGFTKSLTRTTPRHLKRLRGKNLGVSNNYCGHTFKIDAVSASGR